MTRELTPETRKEKEREKDAKTEASLEEGRQLRKIVENKANGLRIFDKIKEGLLRETMLVLQNNETGFSDLSNRLGEAREMNMDEYDRELTALEQELGDQLAKMNMGRADLEQVAKDFDADLRKYIISNTVSALEGEKRETAAVQTDLVDRREHLRGIRRELVRKLGEVAPGSLPTSTRQ